VKWSPSGEKFIFSQTARDGRNLVMFVSNKTGTTIKELEVKTLPEKCVFTKDEKNIVCAAPKTTPDIIWPDDYYKKLYTTREEIVAVSLLSGKTDSLYEFNTASISDATNLILSDKEDMLVFLDRIDEHLYSLELK